MKHWSFAASTATLALFAGHAQADVTPEQVWQSWQDLSTAYGQTLVAGSTSTDGDALVVTDMTSSTEQDGSKFQSTIKEVRFTDQGDGTVAITMSDSYVIVLENAAIDDVPASSAEITVSQPDLKVIASGTPEATSYAFTAPKLDISLTKVDGKDAAAEGTVVQGTLSNVAGGYQIAPDSAGKVIDSTFSADSLALAVKAKNAEDGSDVDLTASVSGITGKGSGNFIGMENADLAAALKAGFKTDFSLGYGPVSYAVNVTEAKGPTAITGSSQGGSLALAMDATRLMLESAGKGVQMVMSSPDIPLPEVSLGYAESGFRLLMPVAKSDTPQDFAFLAKLVDLEVADGIWSMLDPTGQLPHDPATVVIDTKGTATLTHDLMNEAEMAALGDAPPGQINSVELTELQAKIVGAELTGDGAFTFDNTDTTTFQGMPAPTGQLNLKLVGGNMLLDKLVAMGIISSDDAMGARMMLSMFATKGAAEDELTSTLEFKDKHFYANGQQLQ